MSIENIKRYFPISKHWKKLKPIYFSPEVKETTIIEMNCNRKNKAKIHNFNFNFKEDLVFHPPIYYDSCDWRFNRKGRPPSFDEWICHGACHWIANINAEVAMKAFPNKEWRVINSEFHSTVWDGKETIYDTNFLGLGIPIKETVEGMLNSDDLIIHEPGYIPYNSLEDYD